MAQKAPSKVDWQYRAFPVEEHRQRLDRAQALLEEVGLVGCICTAPELIYYFTGYEAHTHHVIGSQAMILAIDDDKPTLILRDGDVPQAEETLVLGELMPFRLGAITLGELVGRALSDLGIRGKACRTRPGRADHDRRAYAGDQGGSGRCCGSGLLAPPWPTLHCAFVAGDRLPEAGCRLC